jgi:hypothetical protein
MRHRAMSSPPLHVALSPCLSSGDGHEAQLLNYLKATPYEVGLLLNFGPKPEVKRKAYDNEGEGSLSWAK